MQLDLDWDVIESIVDSFLYQKATTNALLLYCHDCNQEPQLTPNYCYVCPSCGITFYFNDECQFNQRMQKRTYKRINHLKEFLKNACAEIPIPLTDDLAQRIRVLSNNDPYQVKTALKIMKLTKFYDKVPYIQFKLYHTKPIVIPLTTREEIYKIFLRFNTIYNRCKTSTRRKRNIYNFNYIVNRILLLLGHDELASHFMLIKSQKKLNEMDHMFQAMITY